MNFQVLLHPHTLLGQRKVYSLHPCFGQPSCYSCGKYRILPSEKCNAALSKGLIAIKSDQSLAWNSIKQLEDDFLLYGKYNLDSLEKLIHTVNHLGDRVHQMEKLLLGKDHTVATQQFLHSSHIGRLLFAHKLNI